MELLHIGKQMKMENYKNLSKEHKAESKDLRVPISVRYWRKQSRDDNQPLDLRFTNLEQAFNNLLKIYLDEKMK